ncbi:MAG TPA: DUF2191 domain-containing protein [Acidimicrobiia bacterium]|jgi:hypothetical protein|nr:DUF2191 domain-containing protein [Acidimicrobiia bacterium]
MKTTIEISDDLLRRAKTTAAAEGTTLRALVESGPRNQIRSRQHDGYVLPDASFGGNGVQPGIDEGDWWTLRGLIYAGRGT